MKLRYIGSTTHLKGKNKENKDVVWPIQIEEIVEVKEIIQSSRPGYVVLTDMYKNTFASVHFASFIIES